MPNLSSPGMTPTITILTLCIAGTLAAQQQCLGGRAPYGDLGIRMLQCVGANCLVAGGNAEPNVDRHTFLVEPRLWKLAAPAAGQIAEGDVLVAIDGEPITTRDGGARLARVRPNDDVDLHIRRGNTELNVRLHAGATCDRPSIQLTSRPGDPDAISKQWIDGMLRRMRADGGAKVLVRVRADLSAKAPNGVFGFVVQTDVGAPAPAPPVVVGIRPGSPAMRAGLEVGDAIAGIDGYSMSSSHARDRLATPSRDPLRLTVIRDGRTRTVTVALGAP
jgi:S1-C subfamily serine protease